MDSFDSFLKDQDEGVVERLLATHDEAGVWFEFAEEVINVILKLPFESVVGEARLLRCSFGGERGRP